MVGSERAAAMALRPSGLALAGHEVEVAAFVGLLHVLAIELA